jgi:preprotein translocase subunit SecB
MEDKPNIQNKIRFSKFFVESLNYNCSNLISEDFNEELDIGLKVTSAFSDEDLKSYIIKLDLELKSKDRNFELDCKAIGFFETNDDIDDDFKISSFVKISSPAIMFPFLRSYINTITTNSGIPPLILPSFNFMN